jgi:hypothetical protein
VIYGLLAIAASRWARFALFTDSLAKDWIDWWLRTPGREWCARTAMCLATSALMILVLGWFEFNSLDKNFPLSWLVLQGLCCCWWWFDGSFKKSWREWQKKANS